MPKGFWTASYIGAVVLINYLFVIIPMVPVFGTMFPPVMLVVGFVFVFRDFSQNEIGHWVFVAMLVAGGISYFMSAPVVAIASVTAFFISEAVDWGVFTFTKKPLATRILLSSTFAVPIDTAVFLQMVGHLDMVNFVLVSIAKMIGAVTFWIVLRKRAAKLVGVANEECSSRYYLYWIYATFKSVVLYRTTGAHRQR